MSDEYELRQKKRDEEYSVAYRAWVASLSPWERERLAAKGLIKPASAAYKTGGEQYDDHGGGIEEPRQAANTVAEWHEQRRREEAAEEEEQRTVSVSHEAYLSALRYVVVVVQDGRSARLEADSLAVATGLSIRQGISLTEYAKRHGISKQAFQIRVKKHCQRLGLPMPRGSKSPESAEAYRNSNSRQRKPK